MSCSGAPRMHACMHACMPHPSCTFSLKSTTESTYTLELVTISKRHCDGGNALWRVPALYDLMSMISATSIEPDVWKYGVRCSGLGQVSRVGCDWVGGVGVGWRRRRVRVNPYNEQPLARTQTPTRTFELGGLLIGIILVRARAVTHKIPTLPCFRYARVIARLSRCGEWVGELWSWPWSSCRG